MSETLVSLIMPAWQPRPDWLREAVKGALGQRGCEIELLVIDDGSPEPVTSLLADFDDPRLRVIRSGHGGASAARNTGTAEARGGYLRFIDADDVIEDESTAQLLALTEGRDDVIAYGATLFCDQDLRPLWTMTSDVEGSAVTAALLGRFTTRVHAFLFPRRVVEQAGEWSTEIHVVQDWDFILRALEHASVRGTSSVATRYRRHPRGLTANTAEAARGSEQVVERYFERHPEQRGTALERKSWARVLAHSGRVYLTHGYFGRGIGSLARAAIRDPGAIAVEVAQGAPAATSLARHLIRTHRASLREQRKPRASSSGEETDNH
jgi:glycosyltransferase involved in cell wall biosynthesis